MTENHLSAVLDLIGLGATTLGAVLLALPTITDILTKRDRAAISVWKTTTVETPGAASVTSAGKFVEDLGAKNLTRDLKRVGLGLFLVFAGLLLSIAAKIGAVT